ncbi:uncharacterized protein LOC130735968 [Lotus japonicus]|uniref:uncharacterized protein LOC130735968 n=1 Tax=Lotus japonicus TaxID=34305 RepID=UPI00258E288B|nr:uncharacterized protein LOC130735968 [Lotus japonicus]
MVVMAGFVVAMERIGGGLNMKEEATRDDGEGLTLKVAFVSSIYTDLAPFPHDIRTPNQELLSRRYRCHSSAVLKKSDEDVERRDEDDIILGVKRLLGSYIKERREYNVKNVVNKPVQRVISIVKNIEIANDEIETGRGGNQIGTLQRPGDTRWSSHLNSITHLLRLYNATTTVLEDLAIEGSTYSQRGDATYAFKSLMSFEFVFILHLMKELMGICDKLCQALQKKTQDILNAICLVSTTKSLIQELRDFCWNSLLQNVRSFCDTRSIEVSDMSYSFSDIIRSRRQKDKVTIEHHYRIDVLNVVIDYQLKELNSRFSEQATGLLKLSTTLDPKDSFKSFNVEHICSLVEKFYPSYFSGQEKIQLPYELQHYEFDLIKDVNFHNLSTIATTERAFSAMKVIKTRLRNKMEDDFLTDYMVVYIEKEIAEKYTSFIFIYNVDALLC